MLTNSGLVWGSSFVLSEGFLQEGGFRGTLLLRRGGLGQSINDTHVTLSPAL